MLKKQLVVNNHTGLHARPASDLATLCQKFDSNIIIKSGTMEINPKSVISILAGGVNQGQMITLQIDGPDEEAAGEKIEEFMMNLSD
jgi:phosphocarrier protein